MLWIFDESVFLTVYYLQRYKTKRMILYESNIMNWSSFRVMGNLQGDLRLRELTINWFFFPQPPSSLASDHNPSYPGVGPLPPQRPGLQDNGKFGVAWVIYRIHMQTQINPLGLKIGFKSPTEG